VFWGWWLSVGDVSFVAAAEQVCLRHVFERRQRRGRCNVRRFAGRLFHTFAPNPNSLYSANPKTNPKSNPTKHTVYAANPDPVWVFGRNLLRCITGRFVRVRRVIYAAPLAISRRQHHRAPLDRALLSISSSRMRATAPSVLRGQPRHFTWWCATARGWRRGRCARWYPTSPTYRCTKPTSWIFSLK